MRASAPGVPAVPAATHWERYQAQSGLQVTGFARYIVDRPTLERVVAAYTTPAEGLGVTAVTAFPLLAWRDPSLGGGAVVLAVGDGPIAGRGIMPGHVVREVGGRDVADAAAFVRELAAEHARLQQSGGTLTIEVVGGDGGSQLFEIPVARLEADGGTRPVVRGGSGSGSARGSGGGSGGGGTGNVNVWDRYGGGGPPRDDPRQ